MLISSMYGKMAEERRRKNRIIRWIGIPLAWAIAGTIFWAIFFKLAPWIGSAIPAGEWHQFGVVVIYVLIAMFGGIFLPLFVGFGGTKFILYVTD